MEEMDDERIGDVILFQNYRIENYSKIQVDDEDDVLFVETQESTAPPIEIVDSDDEEEINVMVYEVDEASFSEPEKIIPTSIGLVNNVEKLEAALNQILSNKMFYCKICNEFLPFSDENNLEYHFIRVHSIQKPLLPLECPMIGCKRQFKANGKEDLMDHAWIEHFEYGEKIVNEKNVDEYLKNPRYRIFLETVILKLQTLGQFYCTICKKFKLLKTLSEHYSIFHLSVSPEKPLVCPVINCTTKFGIDENDKLSRHIRVRHLRYINLCFICNQPFETKDKLSKHKCRFHKLRRIQHPYTANTIELLKEFFEKSSKNIFKCNICKLNVGIDTVEHHFNSFHASFDMRLPIPCPIYKCGASFDIQSLSTLNDHILNSHIQYEEVEISILVCPMENCNSIFKLDEEEDFQKHVESHAKSKSTIDSLEMEPSNQNPRITVVKYMTPEEIMITKRPINYVKETKNLKSSPVFEIPARIEIVNRKNCETTNIAATTANGRKQTDLDKSIAVNSRSLLKPILKQNKDIQITQTVYNSETIECLKILMKRQVVSNAYKCKFCDGKYIHEKSIFSHLNMMHGPKEPNSLVECPVENCVHVFKSHECKSMPMHIKLLHLGFKKIASSNEEGKVVEKTDSNSQKFVKQPIINSLNEKVSDLGHQSFIAQPTKLPQNTEDLNGVSTNSSNFVVAQAIQKHFNENPIGLTTDVQEKTIGQTTDTRLIQENWGKSTLGQTIDKQSFQENCDEKSMGQTTDEQPSQENWDEKSTEPQVSNKKLWEQLFENTDYQNWSIEEQISMEPPIDMISGQQNWNEPLEREHTQQVVEQSFQNDQNNSISNSSGLLTIMASAGIQVVSNSSSELLKTEYDQDVQEIFEPQRIFEEFTQPHEIFVSQNNLFEKPQISSFGLEANKTVKLHKMMLDMLKHNVIYCRICCIKQDSIDHYLNHIKEHNLSEPKLYCLIKNCNVEYETNELILLVNHIKKIHLGYIFKCRVCAEPFLKIKIRCSHERHKHSDEEVQQGRLAEKSRLQVKSSKKEAVTEVVKSVILEPLFLAPVGEPSEGTTQSYVNVTMSDNNDNHNAFVNITTNPNLMPQESPQKNKRDLRLANFLNEDQDMECEELLITNYFEKQKQTYSEDQQISEYSNRQQSFESKELLITDYLSEEKPSECSEDRHHSEYPNFNRTQECPRELLITNYPNDQNLQECLGDRQKDDDVLKDLQCEETTYDENDSDYEVILFEPEDESCYDDL